MVVPYPPSAIAAVVAAVPAAAIAGYAARNHDAPGGRPLAALFAAVLVWSLASAFRATSGSVGVKVFWASLQYVGVVVVPAAWLAFALEYAGYREWLTRRTLALLAVEPLAVLALVWTAPAHDLFWRAVAVETQGGFPVLRPEYGIGFWLHAAYSYLVVVAGIAFILRLALVGPSRYRRQAVALLVGALVPLVANVLFLSGVLDPTIDPMSLTFSVTGVALAWALYRHDLLDIGPATRQLAREELVESMVDGVVVANDRGLIVDLNPAGALVIGQPRDDAVGRPLAEVAPEIEAAVPDEPPQEWERTSLTVDHGSGERHYDVRISPVGDGAAPGGSLIVLRDVTDRERRQQHLAVLNRVLRHDLRNEMNVLLGEAEDLLADGDDVNERARRIREKGLEITSLSDRARDLEQTIGDDEIVLERIDLVGVVERLADGIDRDYPDVDLRTDLPERAPVYANELLDSVVRNLVENAIEHNDREPPTVRVSVDVGEEFVDLRVADDGPGIPPEERAVLEEGTETQLQHSSGLGLWLVNWIVTESGGRIEFVDNEPRGTVVIVSLIAAED